MRTMLLSLATAMIASLGLTACTNTNTNTNTNTTNTNMASPAAAATPTPENSRGSYTAKQAQEERQRAKASKETIGDTLDDAWIHTKIVAKLIANSKTPERKINVDVVKNVVTLRGTVDTAEEKAAAEKVAKDTDGVKSVVNQLKVAPPPKSSPAKTATPKTTKSY